MNSHAVAEAMLRSKSLARRRLRLPCTGEECIQAGAHHVCMGWTTGAIGPSLRWGDGNFGDGCVDPEIDIYRLFANLLLTHVFSSQLIGVFRIMLRSKAMVDAKQGCFGDDAPVTGIPKANKPTKTALITRRLRRSCNSYIMP
jgi:hypothetical protein